MAIIEAGDREKVCVVSTYILISALMGNLPFHFCPRLVFGIVAERDRRNEAFGQFNHHDLDRVHQYYVAVAVAIRATPTTAELQRD